MWVVLTVKIVKAVLLISPQQWHYSMKYMERSSATSIKIIIPDMDEERVHPSW